MSKGKRKDEKKIHVECNIRVHNDNNEMIYKVFDPDEVAAIMTMCIRALRMIYDGESKIPAELVHAIFFKMFLTVPDEKKEEYKDYIKENFGLVFGGEPIKENVMAH